MVGWGDCEESAILLAAFAHGLGYECAFLRIHNDGFLGIGRFGHLDLRIAPQDEGEFSLRNRVQQFCTLGSARGRSFSVTENLNGHATGNGRYSKGDTYELAVASSTRSRHTAARFIYQIFHNATSHTIRTVITVGTTV